MYSVVLPEVFKYTIFGTPEEISHIAEILMRSKPGAPHGSSFAVTSDAGRDKRCLWLSEASFQTLIGMNIIPGMFDAKATGDPI
jgi:hypothetical protein